MAIKKYTLRPKEYKLLELLAESAGQTISKKAIAEQVWDIIAASQLSSIHRDFILQFGIEAVPPGEATMEVLGDETLLKIVFLNLLKNAYTCSDNQKVQCILHQEHDFIKLFITNTGDVPTAPDTASLFTTFTRGDNVKNAQGSGVGLRLVQRILQYHHATIIYKIPAEKTNQIIVTFPVPPTLSS